MGLGKLDLTVSEQSEGRSDAESRPCRTRNVAGELVEAVPLRREGSGGRGQDGWLCGRGTGGVTSSETGVEQFLSFCQFVSPVRHSACHSLPRELHVCACVDEGG